MSQLDPLNGFVVLKPIETQEETIGNIIVPDMGKERPEMAEVVEISDMYNFHTDSVVKSSKLRKGDVVLVPKMGSQRITLDGQEYYIVRITEIFAIVKK
jgi:chaperonin GroES